ncbi:hypothetical protein BDV25DRAFT_153576 [Aspergillus avenaceus]|uniref:histidine kinase n=1 Tax=Aspergillus avenaceus TaxID=36643 RepID=A0A5N6TX41_ASPAV|nr:hypothetical protein BDV25DRAFT_153576 [Aspergillus avenaceus]
MAASFPRPPPTDAERERIRELSKYYCTLDRIPTLNEHEEQQQEEDDSPRLSSDITLTALSQLAVLRFGCNRAFISIIDDGNQHIIAEATSSISLRDRDQHRPDDAIFLGVRTIDLAWGVCPHTIALFTGQDMSNAIETPNMIATRSRFIVHDFTQEDFFKDRPYVVGWPYFRFYAEVPLYSPSGVVLGSFCVVDNKPRDHFGEDEVANLKDIADAVALHLDKVRISIDHSRAEKLINGLTNFVKDHGEFDPVDLPHRVSRPPTFMNMKSHAWSSPAFATPGSTACGNAEGSTTVSTPSEVEISSLFSGLACSEQTKTSSFLYSQAHSVTPGLTEEILSPREAVPDRRDLPTVAVRSTVGKSNQITEVFARASVSLRDSLDLDGVLFLDASRCNSGVVSSEGEAGNWEPLPASANPEFLADPVRSSGGLPGVGSLSKAAEKPCEVLGGANSTSASWGSGLTTIPERLLNQLTVAFPQGQFFNLREWADDCQRNSDDLAEQSDGHDVDFPLRDILRQLQECLPDAYSVLWSPLWCWRQSRWVAGTLVWARRSQRGLGIYDLPYLRVLGDSIISELARIDWSTTQQAKSQFISSVSHELRSPLHGILASTEVLEGTPLQPTQLHWINMLKTCGLTLFDTLNHLLDFAKINNLTLEGASEKGLGPGDRANLMTTFDLADLIEEATRVQYAGQQAPKTAVPFADLLTTPKNEDPPDELTVVIRIQDQQEWNIQSLPGAWKRIVMKLIGNSLKFTTSGFVEVSLSKAVTKSDAGHVFAHLSVTDTGKGIDPVFLKNNLFSPFAQEDTLSEGLGLGFSIVRQLVGSMNGHVNVRSEVGIGTQVDIYIPVQCIATDQPPQNAELSPSLKVCMVGFDGYPDLGESPTGILPVEAKRRLAIRSSLLPILLAQSGWSVSLAQRMESARGDIAIVDEKEFADAMIDGQLSPELCEKAGFKFFITLSGKTHRLEKLPSNVIRVSPPFGPKGFHEAIQKLQELCSRPIDPPSLGVEHAVSKQPPSEPILPASPKVPDAAAIAPPLSTSSQSLSEIHCLLVDDNDINLKVSRLTRCPTPILGLTSVGKDFGDLYAQIKLQL